MKTLKNNFWININKSLKNGAFVFIFLLGIESFKFKIPYCIVMGTFLILTSLLFFPWLDKICNIISAKLSSKDKWVIAILNLFLAAYLIKPEETSYYKCILPICLMIFVWVIVIIYRTLKSKKIN